MINLKINKNGFVDSENLLLGIVKSIKKSLLSQKVFMNIKISDDSKFVELSGGDSTVLQNDDDYIYADVTIRKTIKIKKEDVGKMFDLDEFRKSALNSLLSASEFTKDTSSKLK